VPCCSRSRTPREGPSSSWRRLGSDNPCLGGKTPNRIKPVDLIDRTHPHLRRILAFAQCCRDALHHKAAVGKNAKGSRRAHVVRCSPECVAKLDEEQLARNIRIEAREFLNQHGALALGLESILRAGPLKIVLQQNRPTTDLVSAGTGCFPFLAVFSCGVGDPILGPRFAKKLRPASRLNASVEPTPIRVAG